MGPRVIAQRALSLLAMGVIAGACGGGGPPAPADAVIVAAERLVLTEDDLPEGLRLVEQERLDNRTVAQWWPAPKEWLEKYETWGRMDGFRVEFRTDSSQESIESRATVYRAADGAGEAFHKVWEEGTKALRQGFEEQGVEIDVFEELPGPSLGDESLMLHVSASADSLGSTALDMVNVAFRRGNIIASIAWVSPGAPIDQDDAISLAQKQDERIQAVRAALGD